MGYAAKGQLRELSGQEFDEVDGKPYDLRQCDPRRKVRAALMDGVPTTANQLHPDLTAGGVKSPSSLQAL